MRTKTQVAALIEMFQSDLSKLNAIPRKTKRIKSTMASLTRHLGELRAELETAPE